MDKEKIIKFINEEIGNFDFLNNDKYVKEQGHTDLINDEILQKQFICDSLLNKNKLKVVEINDSKIDFNFDNEDKDLMNIEYGIKIEYKYDLKEKPLNFVLFFYGDNITQNISNINWNNIKVVLYDNLGNTVEFIAFEKAPQNIKNIFIREFLRPFMEDYTSMNMKEKLNKSGILHYC